MTLTDEDVERISGLGVSDFYDYKNGYLQLKNVHGHCIFLDRNLCSIQENKPAGCRLYPLILDVDTIEAFLHDFCPHTEEFEFTVEHENELKELVEREEKEKDQRILKRLHELSGS
jgi:Fe-S-cluster containining protein